MGPGSRGPRGTWVAVNLPFALLAPTGWWEFFRYNAARVADWDSLWYLACERTTGQTCTNTRLVNVASVGLFVAWVAVVWVLKARREPGFPRWTLGFPILVLFLLTNKVYSPQFSLWLLPWFALAFPRLGWFAAFELADVAVFVTRFSWFGRYLGIDGGLAGCGRRVRARGRDPRAHPRLLRDRWVRGAQAGRMARRPGRGTPAAAEVLDVMRAGMRANRRAPHPSSRTPGEDNRAVPASTRTIGIGVVFLLVAGTLAVGLAFKFPCVVDDWNDGRAFTRGCYTDLVGLIQSEQLTGGRLPYLDPCKASPRAPATSTRCSRCTRCGSPRGRRAQQHALLLRERHPDVDRSVLDRLCLYIMVGAASCTSRSPRHSPRDQKLGPAHRRDHDGRHPRVLPPTRRLVRRAARARRRRKAVPGAVHHPLRRRPVPGPGAGPRDPPPVGCGRRPGSR